MFCKMYHILLFLHVIWIKGIQLINQSILIHQSPTYTTSVVFIFCFLYDDLKQVGLVGPVPQAVPKTQTYPGVWPHTMWWLATSAKQVLYGPISGQITFSWGGVRLGFVKDLVIHCVVTRGRVSSVCCMLCVIVRHDPDIDLWPHIWNYKIKMIRYGF